ncbi:MAG: ABC transporter ATP-binding protein [Fimbriimonadaceae bacterium]|nr:ABC transporter ATP-binding protein [Fimbriimonadaceae bacterium]
MDRTPDAAGTAPPPATTSSSGGLRAFLPHLREQRGRILTAVVLALGVSAFNLAVPWLFKRLTEDVLVGQRPTEQRLHLLGWILLWVMLCFVGRRICQSLSSYLALSVTQRLAVAVRRDVYNHLHRLRLEFFDDQRTGVLVSNVTNDVTALQYLLHDGLVQVFTSPVTVLGSIVLIFRMDAILGLLTLLVFPLLYLLVSRTRDRVRQINEENQTALSHLTTLFLEAVWNIRIVRAFQRQEHEIAKFEASNRDSLRLRLRNAALNVWIEFITESTILVGFAAVLWIIGYRIATGQIELSALIAMVAYLQMMRSSLINLSTAYARYQMASGAATRLLALLHEPALPPPPRLTTSLPPTWRGELDIRGLHFAYPDGTVIFAGADLQIAAGQKVALIGASGTGKSTLATLLLGLYRPQAGTLRLDGVDLAELPPEVLLHVVSIVPQDVGLFSGTVRENIAYAKLEASDQEVIAAAEAANAHGFIGSLAAGYETFVGDQGVKLSGGQKQRLAIARAMLRNPRLLILDEATSHIDPETEALVQEALEHLMTDRTVIVIAHQASALKGVDRVLELRGGRFVDLGPPGPHLLGR